MPNTSRRLRVFRRWMRYEGIECSDALDLVDRGNDEGICVKALCDISDGDLVATIPKKSCLTIKNSGARRVIEDAGLDGSLGLAVALMYEKSLGEESPWYGYFQLLPKSEPIPLLWSAQEIALLAGTEIHKVIKEDQSLMYNDWKNCILPLLDLGPLKYNHTSLYGLENYFAARSLIASRSFEIDEYHGFGMVPLADLFNHKTGAEDVHFTVFFQCNPDDNFHELDGVSKFDDDSTFEVSQSPSQSMSSSSIGDVVDDSSTIKADPDILEMFLVKDVKAGAEVFNTYGSMGNAALLHRYGFTELDNPYDIVNLDLELIFKWSSSLFSTRHSRMRLSFWRKLGYSGCISQNSEYFEISFHGEPQEELLVLLSIILLSDEAFHYLKSAELPLGSSNNSACATLLRKYNIPSRDGYEESEACKNLLLAEDVRNALLSLAEIRERCYGVSSMEDDIRAMNQCFPLKEGKLYHSLVLRVSERRILDKLRSYASRGINSTKNTKTNSSAE